MIEVVAAVIELDGKLLAFQRGAAKYDYVSFKYEFPGGKVESNENFPEALARELAEELGLNANVGEHITTVVHTYPNFSIKMHCFLVKLEKFNGELREHANFVHVSLEEADSLDWIEADKPVLQILRTKYSHVFS